MQRNTEAAQASPPVFVCPDCDEPHTTETARTYCCNSTALNRRNQRWADAPTRAQRWGDDE